jgi:endonuclease/exonuclease/phosphatase family metal-dependent hydrolase
MPKIARRRSVSKLRLASFNIQVGLDTEHYGHYLTRAWRHALPGNDSRRALDMIAERIRSFDFVAIQEADAGSLRTRFVDQIAHLADKAGFDYHGQTVTRDLRPFARHALGYLSRLPVRQEQVHLLPGRIPGRRALELHLSIDAGRTLQMFVTHLSLGRRCQDRQLEYIAEHVLPETPAAIIGDLNTHADALRLHPALRASGFGIPDSTPATYPSWAPNRGIDHILLSHPLELKRLRALPRALSDHLPVAAEISLPRLRER